MVHCRRVTVDSSSSSDSNFHSDFSSASLHRTFPTSPLENSAPSTEPLKCKKWKRDSSGNDNDNETKGSKRPRSQKDHNEEPSLPEYTQNSGVIHFGEVQQFVITAHRGNAEDLDQAIALAREALALRPVGHTDRSKSLNNLAAQLSIRFDYRGNVKDLDQVIALQREVLALLPVGHTDRSMSLNNLAAQFSTPFDHRGNGDDLAQAIALITPPLYSPISKRQLVTGLSSCDANIITHTQPLTSIQLPTDFKKLNTLVLELCEAIGKDARLI